MYPFSVYTTERTSAGMQVGNPHVVHDVPEDEFVAKDIEFEGPCGDEFDVSS